MFWEILQTPVVPSKQQKTEVAALPSTDYLNTSSVRGKAQISSRPQKQTSGPTPRGWGWRWHHRGETHTCKRITWCQESGVGGSQTHKDVHACTRPHIHRYAWVTVITPCMRKHTQKILNYTPTSQTHTHSSFPSTFARNTISPFFSVCGQPVRRKCQINELKHEEETFQTKQMETVSYYYTTPRNTAATAACGY